MNLLHFQQSGQSTNGTNVVLIHGLFGSLENLNMVARNLAKNFVVTSVDVRNHGRSFHQNDMDYQALAQDVINVIEHLALKKVLLLGHSMGGKIAINIALMRPELVEKLIVADIAPVAYPPHHQGIIKGLQAIDLTTITKRQDADKQLAAHVDNVGVRQFLLRNLVSDENGFSFRCNLDYIENCYPQIMAGYDGKAQYRGATLFIKGSESDYITAEHKVIIGKILPNSSAKIIQGAGHWLHAEKSVAFNKIVNNFIDSDKNN
jgi:esterase